MRYYQAVRDVILATPGLTRDARMTVRRVGRWACIGVAVVLVAGIAAAHSR